ncbi:MAG: NADH-quinone oxidoreductase subunit C [Rhodospirillales bacterium]|jgi:NADH-quinone oxidoreductase subunit C|nr:NADH-quinone oxidoreductase subunit C [Rhodospirillales bacterium]
MDAALQDLGEIIAISLPDCVTSTEVVCGELVVHANRDSIIKTLTFLRDDANCHFKQLVDLCGVDYPEREERFDVVYHMLSMTHNTRVRIKVRTDEDTPVPSVVELFSTAGWFERETWDMFGVYFSNNPDLRRLLTDYGFEGHPLRKDFPLSGYVELHYNDELKRVVYTPIKMTQEYRSFDFLSPWEGVQKEMPVEAVADDNSDEGAS